jgi:hypothetical protein
MSLSLLSLFVYASAQSTPTSMSQRNRQDCDSYLTGNDQRPQYPIEGTTSVLPGNLCNSQLCFPENTISHPPGTFSYPPETSACPPGTFSYPPYLPEAGSHYLPTIISHQRTPGYYNAVEPSSPFGFPSYIEPDNGRTSVDPAGRTFPGKASYIPQEDGPLRTVYSLSQDPNCSFAHAPSQPHIIVSQPTIKWCDIERRFQDRLRKWYRWRGIVDGSEDDLLFRQDMWNILHQGNIDYALYRKTGEKIHCRRCNGKKTT